MSTTNLRLCFFAILAKEAISATSNKGLLTVSQYKTLVDGVMAASTRSNLVMSTKVVFTPNLGAKFFKKAYVPPYIVLLETTWSPCPQSCKIVGVIAPIPEAETLAVSVPSIAANALSKYRLLGEECREYK